MSEYSKIPGISEESASEEVEAFAEELDEYDLLAPEPQEEEETDTTITETDLSATARAFNMRIQRKKKEQEAAHGEAEKAARLRHELMLKALMNIRKSLREVTRIDLGDRFKFSLSADDWLAWPRLAIRLIDSDKPDEEYRQLAVTAHDRNSSGTIEIDCCDSSKPERISLIRDGDLKRLPNLLKKCVRSYLDLVGDIVPDAEVNSDEEVRDDYLAGKKEGDFADDDSQNPANVLSGDLFEEDHGGTDILDTLPTLDDIETLPDLQPGKDNDQN